MSDKYNKFEDLPLGLRKRISMIAEPDEQEWIKKTIPALAGKSFLEQINEDDGYSKVCKFLTKVEGYLR